jgi:protein-L-isoaspartate(D-aspartate) O-methyltransferase
MALVDFTGGLHRSVQRDYLGRVTAHDKAECAELAIRWDKDYWDGERHTGYGGYQYDGRWRAVAERMAAHYDLKPGSRILDVGCGKAFLLYEFTQVVPDCQVVGLDISAYAIANAKEEVRPHLVEGHAKSLPWPDRSFDLVISIMTIHNLLLPDLFQAMAEIERVGTGKAFVSTETYRTERQKMNLLYWQLTCRAFHTPEEWEWIFHQSGYTGDWGFVTFD